MVCAYDLGNVIAALGAGIILGASLMSIVALITLGRK